MRLLNVALYTPKEEIKKKFLSLQTLLGFIIAGIIIYIFLRNFSLSEALASLSKAKWPMFVASFGVFYASLPLRGWRWGSLLRPAGYKVDGFPLSHYYFLAWFANTLLPARIGDLYRAYLLKKNKDVPISLSLGVLFSERIFDLAITAALVFFSGIYFWSFLKGSPQANYIVWGLLAVFGVIVFFVVLIKVLPYVAAKASEKWRNRLETFSLGLFKSASVFPIIAMMTLIIWLSEALRLYFVFLAFDINAGFVMALFVSQASLILMALPISPSGLGLVELMMLKVLSMGAATTDLAAAITIVDRLISYWSLIILGGIVYLFSTRTR